jgi:integrase/recombinase XerD
VPADPHAALWTAYHAHLTDAGRADRTLGEYRRTLYAFWDFCGGKHPGRVTEADLRRWLARPGLAAATRATYAHEVAAAYAWFAATRLVKRNPFAGMALPRHHVGPPRDLPLDAIAAILAYAVSQPRVWLEVWLGYGAGLRVAEMASLRVEDCRLGTGAQLRVHGKGSRWRLVSLHPEVARVLALSLAGRARQGPVLHRHDRPHQGLSRKTVGHELNGAIHAALRDPWPELASATAHQLRHSFATALAAEGVAERAIGLLLGHTDPKTTRRYTAGFSRDAHEAAGRLPIPGRPGGGEVPPGSPP